MAISPEIDKKIINRFDELIEDWKSLLPVVDSDYFSDWSKYQELLVKTHGLVYTVVGKTQDRVGYMDRLKDAETSAYAINVVRDMIGFLIGLKDNYEMGFLEELENWIVANVSGDFMSQAEGLLDEGVAGQFDHVPAAVLCGAVLEDRLRRWCDAQSPPLSTTKSDGSNKTLGPLIQELRKNQGFDKQVLRQLQWWADIRNHAAHGEFEKFDRSDVERMITGVDHFFATRL